MQGVGRTLTALRCIRRVTLIFKKANGELIESVEANVGDDIVDVSWEYDLDIEGQWRSFHLHSGNYIDFD